MGACFSSVPVRSSSSGPVATAKVISVSGDLREYSIPFSVSQVLMMETSSSTCFVCNSDSLFYDDYIPALDTEDELHPNHMYFVLPKTKLQYRLTASDMAALAVKASVALQNASMKGGRRRRNKAKISPVLEVNVRVSEGELIETPDKSFQKRPTSGSARKLQRYSSRRAKMTVRSFRLRLSTIYEGSVL